MFRYLLSLFICFATVPVLAQVSIRFQPTYGGKLLVLEEFYTLKGGDSIAFDAIRFYISDVRLLKGGKVVFREKESYHLIDANDEASTVLRVKIPAGITYDKLLFNLGIDSATSTSGALSGDLDPGKGMFWTWQSGYINCKIEGRSNRCPTRHHDFGLHLGGYAAPDLAMQEIALPAPGKDITVNIPLDKFMATVELTKQHSIMSPGPEAVSLSKKFAAVFHAE